MSAERVRQLRVFFEDRYFSLDYQEQTVRGFRRVRGAAADGTAGAPASAGGPAGQIMPADLEVEPAEPLRGQLRSFLDRCAGCRPALVDGVAGRRALATALAVNRAIAAGSGA